MASTYTTRLRLELPTDGELSGTWGQRVNAGITQMVEEGLAGVASVTHDDSADYTLTTANASTDQARHMILAVGGALTATRNLVCPTQEKLYFVSNETTGSQAFIIKTTAGTGITVPNGKMRIVYCDGTNVVDAITDLPSGTTINNVEIVTVSDTQTLTGKTLTAPVLTLPQINDTSATHQYVFGVNELVADRTVTLPLLTGNDIFTFNDFAATLTNKTIDFSTNTLTGVQAQDAVLDDLAGIVGTVADDEFIVGTGAGTYAHETAASVLTTIGAQPADAVLTDLAGLTEVSGADQFIVSTGTGTYAHETAAATLTTIGAQASDTVLTEISGLGTVADNEIIIGTGAGTYAHESGSTALTSLGAQASDTVLTEISGLGTVADNEFIVGTGAGTYAHESGTTLRTSIGLGTGDAAAFSSLTLTTDLAVAEGGTGGSTHTNHGVLVGQAGSAVAATAAGTAGEVLTSTGASSDPTYQTVTQGQHTIYWPAKAMTATTTSGATPNAVELPSFDVMADTMDYATGADEYAQFSIQLPKSWDQGTIICQFLWSAASGSGTVLWAIQSRAHSDSGALDQAFGTPALATVDTLITANDIHITDEAAVMTVAGTLADEQFAVFQVFRDTSGDSLGVDARLHGVKLHYVTNAETDD